MAKGILFKDLFIYFGKRESEGVVGTDEVGGTDRERDSQADSTLSMETHGGLNMGWISQP